MPTFSGHDSFECRPFWLKKGLDHILLGKKFDDSAVVDLGVGKNMVTAISFWLKAFGITDEKNQPTKFGKDLLADDGFDAYLEDEASLWLLHYHLITRDHASIYNLVFNNYRRRKLEFTREQLHRMVTTDFKGVSEKTLEKDVEVFVKTYSNRADEGEESYGGLLAELQLLSESRKEGKKIIYTLQNTRTDQIPSEIFLYCILDSSPDKKSIGFEELLSGKNSIGVVFCLTREGLAKVLERIASEFKSEGIVYSDNAGVKELQFKKNSSKEKILKDYYELEHA